MVAPGTHPVGLTGSVPASTAGILVGSGHFMSQAQFYPNRSRVPFSSAQAPSSLAFSSMGSGSAFGGAYSSAVIRPAVGYPTYGNTPPTPPVVRNNFDMIDLNHDGVITRDEFEASRETMRIY